jgi:sporadic carbohydrate cluster protein (TIGR04323 family)
MRLPGDHEVASNLDYTGKSAITYAGWSSNFSRDIPLPMQRAIIEPYCTKNNIEYTSYEFENDHLDWMPGLEYYIKEQPDVIVLCSIYSMTDDVERRNEIFNLALEKGVELHFANELCSLKTEKDLNKIETYLNFAVAKKDPYIWELV